MDPMSWGNNAFFEQVQYEGKLYRLKQVVDDGCKCKGISCYSIIISGNVYLLGSTGNMMEENIIKKSE